MERIYPQFWMSLDKDVKETLVKEFKIFKTGVTEVVDSQVVTDGFRTEDLMAINVVSMMEFVLQDTPLPFSRMWELTIAKVKFILNPPIMDISTGEEVDNTPRKAPWCYYCEAKAFAHRPECTRPDKPLVEMPPDEVISSEEIITGEIIAQPEVVAEKNDTKKNSKK
jgi:hypothetical protein